MMRLANRAAILGMLASGMMAGLLAGCGGNGGSTPLGGAVAMAGNGGRRRRAHGACGCATETVISASPGILSAEREYHSRALVRYWRILLCFPSLTGIGAGTFRRF